MRFYTLAAADAGTWTRVAANLWNSFLGHALADECLFFSFACLHSQMADGLTATFSWQPCLVWGGGLASGASGSDGGGEVCAACQIIMKLIGRN